MIHHRQDIKSDTRSNKKSEFYQELIKSALLFGDSVLEDKAWEHLQYDKNHDNIFSSSEKNLQQNAERYGYKCKNVAGNGNCFYLAVAVQLNQVLSLNVNEDEIKNLANCLRRFASEHIELHRNLYEAFIDDSYDFTKQKNDSAWAEDLIITALCHALNVNLVLLRSDYLHNIKKLPDAVCTLFLGYQIDLHYQSLTPLDTHADKVNQSILNNYLNRASVDKFNAPVTVTTQEQLISKLNDLLSEKIVEGKLIPVKKVIKDNLINCLFDVLKDYDRNNRPKNHDAINLLKLFITDKKEVYYYGLNDFMNTQEKKLAIEQFTLFGH